jgi:hypothetical protein
MSCAAQEGGDSSFVSTIPIISADGVWHTQLDNLVWGFGHDGGPSDFVWSPDSRLLAFVDDDLFVSGETYLETAEISGQNNYERLRGGLSSPPVALAWQRSPVR